MVVPTQEAYHQHATLSLPVRGRIMMHVRQRHTLGRGIALTCAFRASGVRAERVLI